MPKSKSVPQKLYELIYSIKVAYDINDYIDRKKAVEHIISIIRRDVLKKVDSTTQDYSVVGEIIANRYRQECLRRLE